MRILTLWQPWASLVAMGGRVKPHETRSWVTNYRGPIAIHAAKAGTGCLPTDCDWADGHLSAAGLPALSRPLPLGAIVAVGEIIDCVRMPDARPAHELDRVFGDWTAGRFAWRLANVRPLATPYPYQGGQGLRVLPDALVPALLREHMAGRGLAKTKSNQESCER